MTGVQTCALPILSNDGLFYNNINTEIKDYSRKTVTAEFKGSLYSKVLNRNVEEDEIEIFIPKEEVNYEVTYNFNKNSNSSIYDFEKLKTKDKYQIFFALYNIKISLISFSAIYSSKFSLKYLISTT